MRSAGLEPAITLNSGNEILVETVRLYKHLESVQSGFRGNWTAVTASKAGHEPRAPAC